MIKNLKGDGKKIELLPLIDVIFLLLIFFLVTLNIVPVVSKNDMFESQFAMPVVTADDAARVDMLIQLHQFPNDEAQNVYYFTIDGEMEDIPIPPGTWNMINMWSQNKNSLVPLQRRFEKHYFTNAEQINFTGKSQVIISSNEWVPYEKVLEVIQACVTNNVKYYFVVGGFEELPQKVEYTEPTNIAYRYEW